MKTRILSLLLCLALCLALLPTVIFAAGPTIISKIEISNFDPQFNDQMTGYEATASVRNYTLPEDANYNKGSWNVWIRQDGNNVYGEKLVAGAETFLTLEIYANPYETDAVNPPYDFDKDNLDKLEIYINGVKRTDVTIDRYNESWREVDICVPVTVPHYTETLYTVTFDSNGGSAVASQQVRPDGHVIEPEKPVLAGKSFTGWYLDEALTEKFYFSTDTISADTTLYAGWEDRIVAQYIQKIEISDFYPDLTDEMTGAEAAESVKGFTLPDGANYSNGINNVWVRQNGVSNSKEKLAAGTETSLILEFFANPYEMNADNPPYDFDKDNLDKLEIYINGEKRTDVTIDRYNESWREVDLLIPVTVRSASAPVVLPFTDVKASDWSYEDIAYVFERGLMNGTSETTFSPALTTTRGMIVTILYRLSSSPAVSGTCPFDDVSSGSYYEKPITWAAENNIVGGYGGGKFGPDDPITREQMAAILYRYSAFRGSDVSASADLSKYTDAAQISDYAKVPIAWANAEGLINGMTPTTIVPQGNATREQVAAILHRFCS